MATPAANQPCEGGRHLWGETRDRRRCLHKNTTVVETFLGPGEGGWSGPRDIAGGIRTHETLYRNMLDSKPWSHPLVRGATPAVQGRKARTVHAEHGRQNGPVREGRTARAHAMLTLGAQKKKERGRRANPHRRIEFHPDLRAGRNRPRLPMAPLTRSTVACST